MNIEDLRKLMDAALYSEQPEIRAFCDPWYSPYYQLMFLLAFQNPGCICIELGVDQGRGSFSYLQGGAGFVYAVDNDVNKKAERLSGFANFRLITAPSTPCPIQDLQPRSVDVLLIDTEHSWDQAAAEFAAYHPYLKDGAVVLFDDTHAKEDDVLHYVDSLSFEKIHDDRLHETCGFSAMIFRVAA